MIPSSRGGLHRFMISLHFIMNVLDVKYKLYMSLKPCLNIITLENQQMTDIEITKKFYVKNMLNCYSKESNWEELEEENGRQKAI